MGLALPQNGSSPTPGTALRRPPEGRGPSQGPSLSSSSSHANRLLVVKASLEQLKHYSSPSTHVSERGTKFLKQLLFTYGGICPHSDRQLSVLSVLNGNRQDQGGFISLYRKEHPT